MIKGVLMEFKDAVVYVRAKLDLTQTELAEKLKLSFPTISRWENGRTKPTKKEIVVFKEFCKENNLKLEDVEL